MIEKFLMWFINGIGQVFELRGSWQEKRARQTSDAPWTNNLWQLRWLGLHCRQKGSPGYARRSAPQSSSGLRKGAHFI